jgi:hypothetical protein
MQRRTVHALLLTGLVGMTAACFDPVHEDAVAALGGEQNGVHPGPTHRPGQPCLTCHGGHGPGSPEFAIAGTIFATRGSTEPLPGAIVVLTDSAKVTRQVRANQVGNFYIRRDEWDPTFPIFVELQYPGLPQEPMNTPVNGNGGCASCHRGGGDSSHMPGVYMSEQ